MSGRERAGDAASRLAELEAENTQLKDRLVAHRAQARRSRAIFESATDFAIIATNLEGRVVEWNSGAERTLGWTAEQMRGDVVDRIFTPEDRAAGVPDREMRCALDQGRASDERWHLRADGGHLWASGEMMPLRDDAGEHLGYLKILRDRTSQHLAGQTLQQAEARLRRAQEAGGVGVFSVGMDGVLHATPEFCRIFGIQDRAMICADEFERLVLPEDAARASTARSRAEGTTTPEAEYRIRRADDGELRWIARRGEAERDDAGRPISFTGVVRDITDQVRAREELAGERERLARMSERYRTVLDSIDVGFCVIEMIWDGDTPVDYLFHEANAAFERQTGMDFPVGRRMRDMHPDHEQHWFDFYGEVERDGLTRRKEIKAANLDRWFDINASRLGEPGDYRVAVLFSDISDRRRMEEHLRDHNAVLEREVEERTAALMLAEEQLRQAQKMEAVGQLTGGIAHDFNNMLTGVIGSLDLIERNIASGRLDRVKRYLEAAETSAQRAAALTARLLAFGRRQSLDLQPTDVNALIGGLEDMLRRTLGEQVSLETRLQVGLSAACTDVNQLESALLNLCINARDAMPGGGRLVIETADARTDERDCIALSVSDTGVGMDRDTMSRVFEPFFTTKPVGQGTGLGLSMVYGFARQAGGDVRISSTPGEGTTIVMLLPLFHGETGDGDEGDDDSDAPRGAGETVLVVEDDPAVRLIVLEVLEELGYSALEAHDANAALPVLQSSNRIDLLITDVGLPGMNGRQLADVAREHRPGLAVLFITGYAENAASRAGFLDRGMAMMTKPFAVEALATKVREMLGRDMSAKRRLT